MKIIDFRFEVKRCSYFKLFLGGILVGIICRLSDFFPYESLWSISSIATLFGFWIASVGMITYCSSSNKDAFFQFVPLHAWYDGQFLCAEIHIRTFRGAVFWRVPNDAVPCVFCDGACLRYWKQYTVLLEQGKSVWLRALRPACQRYACGSDWLSGGTLESENAAWADLI